jgi:hypothetical protein
MNSTESIKVKSKNYDYMRVYVEKHKNERYDCKECGKQNISLFNKGHHLKSKYHVSVINFLKSIEDIKKPIEELKRQI